MPRAKKADEPKTEVEKSKGGVTKPKAPMKPFFFFSKEKRAEVQEKLKSQPRGRGRPKARAGAVPKMLGQMWNEMTPSEKKPYEDKAKDAKAEYDKAMEDYESE